MLNRRTFFVLSLLLAAFAAVSMSMVTTQPSATNPHLTAEELNRLRDTGIAQKKRLLENLRAQVRERYIEKWREKLNDPQYLPFLEKLEIGNAGWLPTVLPTGDGGYWESDPLKGGMLQIVQITSETEMIANVGIAGPDRQSRTTVIVRGLKCDKTDGETLTTDEIFKVSGRGIYKLPLGRTKTVYVLEAVAIQPPQPSSK